MKAIVTSLFLLVSIFSFAQLKQKMADQLFENMEYYHCVDMYKELANKEILGKKNGQIENVRKAALSNYHLFRMDQAVYYFNYLDEKGGLSEKDAEYYIQALRFDAQYKRAEKQLERAIEKHPNNTYFRNLNDNIAKFNHLFNDSSRIHIHKTAINSEYGDFAPTHYENGVIYASKSKNTEVLNGRSKWDNSYYVSLLHYEFEADSNLNNGKLLKQQFANKGHDGPVAFTRDFQKMVITKNILEKKKGKEVMVLALYFSEKKGDKWGELIPFPYNSKDYSVGHGVFSDDGQTLYFTSDMEGGFGGTDLYESTWVDGAWTAPKNLGASINTNQNEMFPFVRGNTLYFASNGHFGLGGLDLFETELNTTVPPKNLGYPINSSADDFGLITNDESGTKGYFSTNRKGAIDGIYSFEREELTIDLLVNIFERYEEDEAVPHHNFVLKNITTETQEQLQTNDKGQLNIAIHPDNEYVLSTEKEDFKLLKKEGVSTINMTDSKQLNVDLILLPTKITIAIRILAKDTQLPLQEARASIANDALDTTMLTNADGIAYLEVDRNKDFIAEGAKKGYIDANQNFNTGNHDGKIFNLELALSPIKKGERFKLENIFYDFDKATLRPESMRSLDKLSEFIIENNLKIELSSHTDSRGSAAYNQNLSQKRAQSCVNYLITQGVSKNQIIAKGYGESQLINHCKDGVKCSEEEHQENRRTEVKILDF